MGLQGRVGSSGPLLYVYVLKCSSCQNTVHMMSSTEKDPYYSKGPNERAHPCSLI